MLTRQNFTQAQHRYARFYLKQLTQLATQHDSNDEQAITAMQRLHAEWEQLQHVQNWVADNLETPEIAQLGSDLAFVGGNILNFQILPQLRLPWFENALIASRFCQDQEAETTHLVNLGLAHIELSHYTIAQEYYDQALELIGKTQNIAPLPTIYNKLARIYFYQGDYERAFATFKESQVLSSEQNNHLQEGLAWEGMAILARRMGKVSDAVQYVKNCQQLFYEINYIEGLNSTHINLGNILATQGHYEESTEEYLAALAIAQKLHSLKNTVSTYSNLGANAYVLGNYEASEYYHQQSLEIAQQIGDQLRVGRALSNLGLVLYFQKKYDEAYRYYMEALSIRETIGHTHGIADTFNRLGKLALAQKQFTQARNYQQQALQIAEDMHDMTSIAQIHVDLADIALAEADWESCLHDCLFCLEKLAELDFPILQGSLLIVIAKYFQAQERFAEMEALLTLIASSSVAHADMLVDVVRMREAMPVITELNPPFDVTNATAVIPALQKLLQADLDYYRSSI